MSHLATFSHCKNAVCSYVRPKKQRICICYKYSHLGRKIWKIKKKKKKTSEEQYSKKGELWKLIMP